MQLDVHFVLVMLFVNYARLYSASFSAYIL
jgi:hypothetical protein